MKSKKVLYNLIAIQILFWFGWQFATYQIVYFQSVGMTTSEIGIMSAACAIVSMIASILWGWLADRMNSIKKAFILNLIISIMFVVAIPLLPTHFKYASVIFIIYRALSCFGQGPLGTLIDNHAVRNCEEFGLNFGTLSAFRCISGALGGLLCTAVLAKIDLKYAFWIFGLFMIPTLVSIFLSNDPKSTVNEREHKSKADGGALKLIFGNRHFMVFIIFTVLFNFAHQAVTIFIPSFMTDINIDSSNWGLYSSVRLFASIPVMLMFGWIRKRMKLKTILILACIFMGVESLMIGLLARDLWMLLLSGAIYGLGSGLIVGAVPLYIYKLAPDNLKASAHNIYGAVYLGAGVVGNLCGGMAYDAMGGFSFYVLLGSIMLMSVLFFIVSSAFERNYKIRHDSDAA